MKSMTGLLAIVLMAALLIAGCDQLPGKGPGTILIDLGAIAKATGQEQVMQTQAQIVREELNAQLIELAGELEQQIEDERSKLGDSPTREQQQQLQQLTAQAQQQYGQLQAEAQQQIQQQEMNLVLDFREQVQPFAEKIARSRNASIVFLSDQTVFWFDPAVDITADVIAALRKEGTFPDAGADQALQTPDIAPATQN